MVRQLAAREPVARDPVALRRQLRGPLEVTAPNEGLAPVLPTAVADAAAVDSVDRS